MLDISNGHTRNWQSHRIVRETVKLLRIFVPLAILIGIAKWILPPLLTILPAYVVLPLLLVLYLLPAKLMSRNSPVGWRVWVLIYLVGIGIVMAIYMTYLLDQHSDEADMWFWMLLGVILLIFAYMFSVLNRPSAESNSNKDEQPKRI